MPRGYFRWRKKSQSGIHSADADVGRRSLNQFEAAAAMAAESVRRASPDVGRLQPESDQLLTLRDELIFLLHTAAEIEHGLLVQYLYAAFSFGDLRLRARSAGGDLEPEQLRQVFTDPVGQGFNSTITQIAKEEMGHLLVVQNVLRVIGGPLNLEREDFPFRGEFYPFPFTLEPATRDAIAKYVAAEMPEDPDRELYPLVDEILVRARIANDGNINRVGRLYGRIIELVEQLPESVFRPETADTLQGNWAGIDTTTLPADKRLIMGTIFGGTKAAAKARVIAALKVIAEQGEGIDQMTAQADVEDSHFDLFYRMYRDFPETNPAFGSVTWHPALPVPSHPSTDPNPIADPATEAGRITSPLSLKWAQLFNTRYRILLTAILHSLSTDRTVAESNGELSGDLSVLSDWIFREMTRTMRSISNVASSLPQKIANPVVLGRPAVAGAPFELPYSQSLPDNAPDRWQLHRDIFVSSLRQLEELRKDVVKVQDVAAKSRMNALIDVLQAGDGAALVSIGRAYVQRKSGPRLYFSGEFRTNVNTANNNSAGAIDSANVNVDTQDLTDEQFHEWMKSVDPDPNIGLRSAWNYFGDNTFGFRNVTITAVESEEGLLNTSDGLVGTAVQCNGVMVDLNPEDVIDTQIFGRQLLISDADGNRLSGRPDVLHSRWLSFRRNQTVRGSKGAAAIFHAAIPHNELEFLTSSMGDLGLLRAAAVQTGGLTVEFCTYFTAPRLSTAELAAKYQVGEEPENPAFGRIVGCIAPWSSSDWSTIPSGRRLNPVPPAAGTPAAAIGPAFVEFEAATSSVRLNLVNAIAEKDASLEKADIGPLSLQVRTGATVSRVGSVPYDKATYEQTAGQVRAQVDSGLFDQISEGLLEIVRDATGDVIFKENALVIETDNRSSYVEAGSSIILRLAARFKGAATASSTRVRMTEYHDLNNPVADADRILEMPPEVEIPRGGSISITVTATSPGFRRIVFSDPATAIGPVSNTTAFFANVRVLPNDNFDALPDDEVTFAKIYEEVLRFYHLVYPAMSNVFPLNDEARMKAMAPLILNRIAAGGMRDFAYMPRTREMSPGKRRLLERWCRKQMTQPGTGRFTQVKQLLDDAVNNENFGGPHGPFWRSQNRNDFVSFLVPVGGGNPPEQLLVVGNASTSNLIRAFNADFRRRFANDNSCIRNRKIPANFMFLSSKMP